MRLIDQVTIPHADGDRSIQLRQGDLAAIPVDQTVDVLVVSAFPGSYAPTRGTLIEALDRVAVSVRQLAENKEVDLRRESHCWLSRPIDRPDLGFRRVLCFEPSDSGRRAAGFVGDVFRSLLPFVSAEPWVKRVAMPLLATGRQRAPKVEMLRAMLEAASNWMAAGLTLEQLQIVLSPTTSANDLAELTAAFAEFRSALRQAPKEPDQEDAYDLFISYSHKDEHAAQELVGLIRGLNPELKVFVDRLSLDPGSAWQREIFQAIDASRRVVCLYSPDYLESQVCQEEFHIGLLRHREQGDVLLPAYLRSAQLPSFMRLVQYLDVREGERPKLEELARTITRTAVPGDRLPAPDPSTLIAPTLGNPVEGAIDLAQLLEALADGQVEVRFEGTITLRSRADRA